jgi:hypothetical protein
VSAKPAREEKDCRKINMQREVTTNSAQCDEAKVESRRLVRLIPTSERAQIANVRAALS